MESKQSLWNSLRQAVLDCHACALRPEAVRPVPGVGSVSSRIAFIGRNPGTVEDLNGEPFIGPAGQALDQLFFPNCGVTRKQVWLDNLVHCHTISDREPELEYVKICTELHLFHYLDELKPYLVVTFGALPAFTLIGALTISREHGRVFRSKRGYYIIPCLHPGAALYKPSLREDVKKDALAVKKFLASKDKYQELMRKWLNADGITGIESSAS